MNLASKIVLQRKTFGKLHAVNGMLPFVLEINKKKFDEILQFPESLLQHEKR